MSSGTRQRCQRASTLSAPMLGLHVAPTEKSRRPVALTPADSADGYTNSEASPAVRCQRCHLRAQEHQGFLPPPPSNFSPTSFRRNPLTPLTPPPPGRSTAVRAPVPALASVDLDWVRPAHGGDAMNRFVTGRRFKSRGQSYEIAGLKDYWTRDDRYVEMIRYKSVCAHPGCRRVFEAITTKTRLRRGQLNKRCPIHHAPGVPAPVKKAKLKTAKKARPKKCPATAGTPPTSPEARDRARLVWKATLAVQRGQPPSYLD